MNINIWVDADSVPQILRSIILKAAVRTGAAVSFVADRNLKDVVQFIASDTHRVRIEQNNPSLKSKIKMIIVKIDQNSADNFIVENAKKDDLCITHDIPLASRLLEKQCFVIDDRGKQYSDSDIKTRLTDREVNSTLRQWGVFADLQKKQKPSDVKAFADKFDSIISLLLRS